MLMNSSCRGHSFSPTHGEVHRVPTPKYDSISPLVYADFRAVARNPEVYDSPDKFRPERFIEYPNLLDPKQYAFGRGRRWVL